MSISDLWLSANLTSDPSFAHNLGCRCPNCQCEAICDIYVSRPFQWHQEHPMRGVLPLIVELWTFGSLGGLQISNFSKCWASPPHLAKVGLRHKRKAKISFVAFFFSIKFCYGEISSGIRAAGARRKRRRSKFTNQEINSSGTLRTWWIWSRQYVQSTFGSKWNNSICIIESHFITRSEFWNTSQSVECFVWYPNTKQKSPFLHLFFSIKVCYGEISSGIRAAAARRRRRLKFSQINKFLKNIENLGNISEEEEEEMDSLLCRKPPNPNS